MRSQKWRRYVLLLRSGLRINAGRLVQFRTSTLIEIGASLVFISIQVAFWNIIYSRVRPLPNWTLGDIYTFMGFAEIFYALSYSLFVAAAKFWTLINTGKIDMYLVRPVDSRILFFLINLHLENLIRPIPSILILFGLAALEGEMNVLKLLTGIPLVFMAATTYALIQLTGGLSAFWLGRARAAEEITSSLLRLLRFPTTILPVTTRVILATLLPFGLAATEPAQIDSVMGVLRLLAYSVIGMALWLVIVEVIWRVGLKRYESYGS